MSALLLEVQNLKKYFADRLLLNIDSLKIYTGDRIGLVGENGSGKTTLLNILSGTLSADEGLIKRGCTISYIRQLEKEIAAPDDYFEKQWKISGKNTAAPMSGGENTRLKIASAFSQEALLLFADEPTANLDMQGVTLLQEKLQGYDSFLLVSHDRTLLDALCNCIWEIKNSKIEIYIGNYSAYAQQRAILQRQKEQEYAAYVSEKSHLEEAVKKKKQHANAMKKTPSRMGNSEARLHKRETQNRKKSVETAAAAIETRLEKLEIKDRPKETPAVLLDFSLVKPPENKFIFSCDNLNFSYEEHVIFQNTGFMIKNHTKTALIGPNGSGKTTLLNLLATANDSIYRVPKAKIGYFYQNFEQFDDQRTVLENVLSTSVQSHAVVRIVLARLLFRGDDVHKNVALLSGGERVKLAFAKLFVSDANVLLLDEPTNYLDMPSRQALSKMLADYQGTVVFVSHDQYFIDQVADELLLLQDRKIITYSGNLSQYQQQKSNPKADITKTMLELRMAEVVSKISHSGEDNEQLEIEYAELVEKLKDF